MRSAGDKKEGNRVFTAAMTLGLLAGLFFLFAGLLFSGPVSRLLGADDDTFAMTNEYMRTLLIFAPAFILNNILTVFVRNDGAPKLAMTAMLTSSFSNILLDYVFMYPLQLGMFGAAFATGLAPLLSAMKGEGRTAEIHRVYRLALTLSSILAVVIYGLVFLFSKEVVSVFNSGNNQSLTELAVTGVRIYFTAFVFAGINILTAVYFSATENAVHSFIISMARGIVLLIPAAFLLSGLFDMNGVWLSFPTAEVLTAAISFVSYKKSR